MPSISCKTERLTMETNDVSKQFLNTIEKKCRNLEKRKSKLDIIHDKEETGGTLEKDQMEAVTHYAEVLSTLEYMKDLFKSFQTLAVDIEKQQKRQAKRDKAERATSDAKRLCSVLMIQSTLDALSSEQVRQDFMAGRHGAVVLTEDNLASLNVLHRLICPSRGSDVHFDCEVETSVDHLLGLLEQRDKPVANSTYRELMELITLVSGCGYFERVPSHGEPLAECDLGDDSESSSEDCNEKGGDDSAGLAADDVGMPSTVNHQGLSPVQHPSAELDRLSLSQHPQTLQTLDANDGAAFFAPDPCSPSLFHSATAAGFQAALAGPPLHHLALSDQSAAGIHQLPVALNPVTVGHFSFLQDSQIDESLHVDPAVVAAQPMMSSTVINLHGRTSPSSLLLPAFPRAPLINQSLLAEPSNSLQLPQQVVSHSALDLSASSHAFSSPIPLDHTRDSRIYSQNRLAHPPNLTDALFPSPLETVSMEQPPQHGRQMEPLHSSMESRSSFDEIPPSIPMPPDQAQQKASLIGRQDKKFQLNASATEFQSRSMYPHLPGASSSSAAEATLHHAALHQPIPVDTDETAGKLSHAANFQAQSTGHFSQKTDTFHNTTQRCVQGEFHQSQHPSRGINVNTSARQNGFVNRASSTNVRPANSGESSFRGYSSRNDHRPDGYQAHNPGGFSSSTTMTKRGGPGYARGGCSRGQGMQGAPPSRYGGPSRATGGHRGGL